MPKDGIDGRDLARRILDAASVRRASGTLRRADPATVEHEGLQAELREVRTRTVLARVESLGGNVTAAARSLKMSRQHVQAIVRTASKSKSG